MYAEGYTVTPEIVARLSPYKTEHIDRFGSYELHLTTCRHLSWKTSGCHRSPRCTIKEGSNGNFPLFLADSLVEL